MKCFGQHVHREEGRQGVQSQWSGDNNVGKTTVRLSMSSFEKPAFCSIEITFEKKYLLILIIRHLKYFFYTFMGMGFKAHKNDKILG